MKIVVVVLLYSTVVVCVIVLLRQQSFPSLGSYNSTGALGALMACLRAARAHGHLRSATDVWRNLVSSARIKQGLIHQHCQVSKQNV